MEDKLNTKQLSEALGISTTTLWRDIKVNQAKAQKYKLEKCPAHRNRDGGRKFYYLSEMSQWLEYVASYKVAAQ